MDDTSSEKTYIHDSDANIDVSPIEVGGITFPSGCNISPTDIKEGNVKVLSDKGVMLATFEYHDGKLDGPCILFNNCGLKKQELRYKNNEPDDWGREYDDKSKLVYEGGVCIKDRRVMRHGKGKVYTSSSSFYVTEFKNGEEKRKLLEINKNEKKMIEYDDNKRVVYVGGYCETGRIEYIKKGKGQFFEYDNKGLKKVYATENGEKKEKRRKFNNGVMTCYKDEGVVYEGGYSGNPKDGFVREGEGEEYDGCWNIVYNGNWKNDKREGQGIFYRNNELKYDGNWKNNKPHGKGRYMNEKGEVVYEGEWVNGFLQIEEMKWFNYSTDKIAVFLTKKDTLPECLYRWFSIEVEDDDASDRIIWIVRILTIAIITVLFVLTVM